MKFYPLTFTPILKDRIWGGTKLKTYLNKPIVSETTGESWEISTVPGDISVVSNGVLQEKNINEIEANFEQMAEDAMYCNMDEESFGVPFLWAEGRCYADEKEITDFFRQKLVSFK